jgi:ribonuclease BN (tRNA processing enzyme)
MKKPSPKPREGRGRAHPTQAIVHCLGTGDGCPSSERNHSAFLYRLGETSFLIDCGEPVDSSLKSLGLGHDSFDCIFISHLHADHFGGFPMLIQGCWLEGRAKELPVYLPGDAISPVTEMLHAGFLFDELFPFTLRLRALSEKSTVKVNDVRVTAFRTSHLDQLRARFQKKYRSEFAAFCFLIESHGLVIGHSADLGKAEDLEPLLKRPLDLLICELAHFSPEQIFEYLRGKAIKKVVFVHVARFYWENLAKLRRLAARMLPDIPHTFARDGEQIRLNRKD